MRHKQNINWQLENGLILYANTKLKPDRKATNTVRNATAF